MFRGINEKEYSKLSGRQEPKSRLNVAYRTASLKPSQYIGALSGKQFIEVGFMESTKTWQLGCRESWSNAVDRRRNASGAVRRCHCMSNRRSLHWDRVARRLAEPLCSNPPT